MTNIAKLLEDVPGCITLWSSVYGKVWLLKVEDNIIYVSSIDGSERKFDEYGRISVDGMLSRECLLFPSNEVRNWEGWEIPHKPNFKVNDWIIFDRTFTIPIQIVEVNQEDDVYVCRSIEGLYGNYDIAHTDKNYHLWTINDAKDGDVLVAPPSKGSEHSEQIFIFKEIKDRSYVKNAVEYYCRCIDNEFATNKCGFMGCSNEYFTPATKEQHNLLFQKMQEAGMDWDEKKKELKKISKHYDIKNFHAGMPVLVRADNNCRWDYSVFSRITGNKDWQFAVCNGISFTQCIPFEGNEHLLGATDPCDEQYINW